MDTSITSKINDVSSPDSQPVPPWGWTLVGLLPFFWVPIFFALAWLVTHAWTALYGQAPVKADPRFLAFIGNGLFFMVLAVCAILVAAWVRGFPAWSYPLAVQFSLASVYMANASMPGLTILGYSFERRLLGVFALLPMLLVVVVSLLLTRRNMAGPIRAAFLGFANDLPRFSFGGLGFTSLFLFLLFDSVHGAETFHVLMAVFLAACALIYLRGRLLSLRIAALFGGFLISWVASSIYLGIYWDGRQEPWMLAPENGIRTFTSVLLCALPVAFFIFSPYIPWIIQSITRRRPT